MHYLKRYWLFVFLSLLLCVSSQFRHSVVQLLTGNTQDITVCRDIPELITLAETKIRVRGLQVVNVSGELSLRTLPRSVTTRLTTLILRNSATTRISTYQQLSSLEILSLAGNPNFDLKSLVGLGSLDHLHSLDLSGVIIDSVDELSQLLKNVPKLRFLDVSNCSLTSLDYCLFCGLANLKFLNLSGNSLRQFQVHKIQLQQLEELDLSHCDLDKVVVRSDGDGPVPANKDLQRLHLSDNNLHCVNPELVYALKNEAIIDVRNNPLQIQSCCTYALFQFHQQSISSGSGGLVLGGVPKLTEFDVRNITYCSWEVCPEGCQCMPTKREVHCSNGDITEIPQIGPFETEFFQLDANHLTSLKGLANQSWASLRILIADNNEITSLDVGGPSGPALVHLSVKYNQLSVLTRQDCDLLTSVEYFDISNNRLVSLDLSDCGYLNIVYLDVAENFIKKLGPVEFASFPHLEFFNVSHNSVGELIEDSFAKTPVLQEIDASHNHIKAITKINTSRSFPYILVRHLSLQHILLQHNDLQDLKKVLSVLSLQQVSMYITDNPWICSCDTIPQDINLATIHGLQCHGTGKTVQDFMESWDDVCKEKEKETPEVDDSIDENNMLDMLIEGALPAMFFLLVLLVCTRHHKCVKVESMSNREDNDINDERYIAVVDRKHHALILHCGTDDEFVVEQLVPQLLEVNPGLELIYCMNLFGMPFLEEFSRQIEQCRTVLVVLSGASFMNFWTRQQVSRCFREQQLHRHFKAMCLLLNNAPSRDQILADPVFSFLAEDRPCVEYADGGSIRQILRFLRNGST